MMTNDVELAAEAESDRWRRTLAEKSDIIMQLRGMTRPQRRARPRQKSGGKPHALDSVPTPEHHLWADSAPTGIAPGRTGVRAIAAIPWRSGNTPRRPKQASVETWANRREGGSDHCCQRRRTHAALASYAVLGCSI